MRLSLDASLLAVERVVEEGLARECRAYNQRKPLITVIAHELSSKAGAAAYANAVKSASAQMEQSQPGMGMGRQTRSRGGSPAVRGRGRPSVGVSTAAYSPAALKVITHLCSKPMHSMHRCLLELLP